MNTWIFEDQQARPLFVDGAITTEKGEITLIVAVEDELELHPGGKRVKARHAKLTTARGEQLLLEAEEIGSIPLAALPGHWSESDAEAMAAAEKAALWFEQHVRFRMGDREGVGFVEHCVAPGCRGHGIDPTPFPYLDPAETRGRES